MSVWSGRVDGRLHELRTAVVAYAAAFDPALITAGDATSVVEDAAAIEKAAAALKALAASRESESGGWRRRGARSPAHDLAQRTGTSVGAAAQTLEAAGRLGELPVLAGAARRGEVSPQQVAAIAGAASADPGAESRLVGLARQASLGELRDECARTEAAARPLAAEEAHAEVHRTRYLRTYKDHKGGWNLSVRNVAEIGAELMAMLKPLVDRVFAEARAEGRHESHEAYAADALAEMVRLAASEGAEPKGAAEPDEAEPDKAEPESGDADGLVATDGAGDGTGDEAEAGGADEAGGGSGPGATLFPADPRPATPPAGRRVARRRKSPVPAKIIVRIDWDALVRGFPVGGELSEISGIGPVPVSVVRAMMETGDPFLAAVATRGVDVATVAHLGRRATAHQVTALEWRDPVCPVLGCNQMANLEIDHREDWAKTKVTLLAWLDRPCDHHHDKKTRQGWAFVPGVGKRPMVAPDDPRHPNNRLGTRPTAESPVDPEQEPEREPEPEGGAEAEQGPGPEGKTEHGDADPSRAA